MSTRNPAGGQRPGRQSREGAALLTVMVLAFLSAMLVGIAAMAASSHMRRIRSTIAMERAFFLAEAGAERAASHLAAAREGSTVSGTLGGGTFIATIAMDPSEGGKIVQGSVPLNPGLSDDFEFFAILPEGGVIARSDLRSTYGGFEGEVKHVHLRRPASANPTNISLGGIPYAINPNESYDIRMDEDAGQPMDVTIRNDNVDAQGQARGQWHIDVHAPAAHIGSSEDAIYAHRRSYFTIVSVGEFQGGRRAVSIRGLHLESWAKYAFWYDTESLQLWMVGGEYFLGPVYANPQMRFHSHQVAQLGQTRFFDRAATTRSSIHRQTSSVNPIFDRGLVLNAPRQDIADIDFGDLRDDASLELEGPTTVVLEGEMMRVTNSLAGWTNHLMAVPQDGLVYVRTRSSWWSTQHGDVNISAPAGFDGRLTIAAERDIRVVNHVRYANDPRTNENSENALGLVAGNHVVVTPAAPNNLEIFAHIIARDGGFGVQNWDSQTVGPRGTLLVHGGIVNSVRNAVGSTAGTGYFKNYVYDQRFGTNPPPRYPRILDQFRWLGWDG